MPDSLLPLWPGVHQLPQPDAPFPVRWSYEAWEGAYGAPWAAHWKPWPWEPPAPDYDPSSIIGHIQQAIRDEALKPRPWIIPPVVL